MIDSGFNIFSPIISLLNQRSSKNLLPFLQGSGD
jgi:hypothetical protein